MEEGINEAAVWDRVTGKHSPTAQGSPAPVGPELLEAMEALGSLILGLRQLEYTGNFQGLRQVVAQLQRQRQLLGALYYVSTGQVPKAASPTVPKSEGYRERLRQSLGSLSLWQGRYEALAQRSTGLIRETLLELSRELPKLFSTLLVLLGSKL